MMTLFWALFLSLLCSSVGFAQVYKYTDKDGNVRFTNTPTSSENEKSEFILPEKTSEKEIMQKCPKPSPKYFNTGGPSGPGSYTYDLQEMKEHRECLKRYGYSKD